MAAIEAIKEVIWFRGFSNELGLNSEDITGYCNSQSALHLIKNPMFHERSKHIDIKLHFIREVIARKEVRAKKVNTDENPTDMLTKVILSNHIHWVSQITCFSNHLSTKEEVMENIEKIGNSAAAVLCNISRIIPFQEQEDHLMKDIIGVVALLGRVHSRRLSRILSKYLGADQMLAVVARSFETAILLEKYKQTGEVDRCHGLHVEAAILDKFIDGRFIVMCFDNISPFRGGVKSGSQRKLALSRPRLIDGTIPKGFLGFAVNRIDLDEDMLSIKNNSGHGLRETLFYHLLGQLHVYETGEDMLAARACIEHGSVSLDGGILKGNSVISFGFISDPGVCFQVVTTNNEMLHYQENLKLLKEKKKSELRTINDEIEQVMKKRSKVLTKFEKIKSEFNKFMDDWERFERTPQGLSSKVSLYGELISTISTSFLI
ncbi:protein DEFECTIVE IN MERISTEM SILENCING 3-like [Humulus lupulus]|uniref:protein DEFECTIVE IN MERISTEM SILENCING 3-like n=1 Tax=Humulus lupulus TaxID=3486 RepID=UPI002B411D13|nr:protein DEFECTIVE IN MERISTEM SILENCING 3-like [Humulus lupulus]